MTTTEPAVTIGAITAAVAAVLALIVAFGVSLTPEQQVAILGIAAVAAPLIVALITRGKVTPSASVVETVSPKGARIAGPASPLPTGSVIPTV